MPGDVEVAHAEREVDRVDVFERRREEEQVRDQEQDGEAPRVALRTDGRDQTGRRRSASFRLPSR